jgi:methionyl-tRNA formyltransferase
MERTIGVFANSKMALPAIQYLRQSGLLIQLVLPDLENPEQAELEHYSTQLGCVIQKWSKSELEGNFNSWVEIHGLEIVFAMTFPFLFSKELIESCKVPFFNVHYAPLPEYRGVQPVFWLIKNRAKKGAVVVHEMKAKVDSGDILHTQDFDISTTETFGSYLSKAGQIGVRAIHECLQKLNSKNWQKQLKQQDESKAKVWGKPTLADIQINWKQMRAAEINSLCRACNPWNKGAMAYLQGQDFKVISVKEIGEDKEVKAGQLHQVRELMTVGTIDHKLLELEMVYLPEGFFRSYQLQAMGFLPNVILD